jgi:nucleotide-binding universal stress UspA family protein
MVVTYATNPEHYLSCRFLPGVPKCCNTDERRRKPREEVNVRNMKVLFAYDGSACAHAALHDLELSGLPTGTECVVLTVADVWLPSEDNSDDARTLGQLDPAVQTRILAIRQKAKCKVGEAAIMAEDGAKIVRAMFPDWKISSEAVADSPAWGILNRADSMRPDLIVVGAHGMSGTERLLIGSVSRKIMNQAVCSVRIARNRLPRGQNPLRIIVGFDGSSDAQTAARALGGRVWPEGTQVRLITALDDTMRTAIAARILKLESWTADTPDHHVWLSRMAASAANRLRSSGLTVSCFVKEGDPKQVLLDAASEWHADSIFLGATGLRGLRRLLVGSVSSGVAAAADCSVEIVR